MNLHNLKTESQHALIEYLNQRYAQSWHFRYVGSVLQYTARGDELYWSPLSLHDEESYMRDMRAQREPRF